MFILIKNLRAVLKFVKWQNITAAFYQSTNQHTVHRGDSVSVISMALCHIVCYLMLNTASADGVIFIWSIKGNLLNEVVTHILNFSAVMWGSGEDSTWNATGSRAESEERVCVCKQAAFSMRAVLFWESSLNKVNIMYRKIIVVQS